MTQTWFSRLTAGLKKTSTKLTSGITDLITKRKLDQDTLDQLEDLLILADMGIEPARQFVADLKKNRFDQEISDMEIRQHLAGCIAQTLEPFAQPLIPDSSHKPHVILVVGVNGAGKTTTIGKLAAQWRGQGLKVRIAAGDTFRAAAVDQLAVWADRAGVPIYTGSQANEDPASLAFDALKISQEAGDDVLIIDTAGRLQNKEHLMAELEKLTRVLKKRDPQAPHSTILVLDGTTGQNAHQQVQLFSKSTPLSGLMITKLDGTAKGGVVVSLAHTYGLPIYALGVGEALEDLQPFSAQDFAHSLVGL